MTIKTFEEACKIVVRECPNAEAKSYARAGLTMSDPDAVHSQALYILNNITSWHSPNAQRVRLFLKSLTSDMKHPQNG